MTVTIYAERAPNPPVNSSALIVALIVACIVILVISICTLAHFGRNRPADGAYRVRLTRNHDDVHTHQFVVADGHPRRRAGLGGHHYSLFTDLPAARRASKSTAEPKQTRVIEVFHEGEWRPIERRSTD